MSGIGEFWNGLPTWGKVGVGLATVGIVIFIATRKPNATTSSGQWVVQPTANAGIPEGSPLGGGSSGGNSNGSNGSNPNGGGSPYWGGGNGNSWQTSPPVMQYDGFPGMNVTPTQATRIRATGNIVAINDYVSNNNANMSDQQINTAHNAKVDNANKIGVQVDDWGVARRWVGGSHTNQPVLAYDDGLSARFKSISDLNGYVANRRGSLNDSDFAGLHAQKVAMASQRGYTVSDDGHVFDTFGKPVGQNGMG